MYKSTEISYQTIIEWNHKSTAKEIIEVQKHRNWTMHFRGNNGSMKGKWKNSWIQVKMETQGLRYDDSVDKNTHCSSRGPMFSSQYSCQVIHHQSMGHLMLLASVISYTCVHKCTHRHTIKNNKKILKIQKWKPEYQKPWDTPMWGSLQFWVTTLK